MKTKDLAKELGFTVLMTRELIKAGHFKAFAWSIKRGTKHTILIDEERYKLWKQGVDMKKALEEEATSTSANNKNC